jgi:monooxygenase
MPLARPAPDQAGSDQAGSDQAGSDQAGSDQAGSDQAGSDDVDVLIIGAGLSGIGAAHQLAARFPQKTFTILESRDRLGGTWDLFRYPGVRSDSDMHTLGYRFRPWTKAKSIADGPSILEYLQDTARENGVEQHIRYGHRVVSAEWSSEDARWTVEAVREVGGRAETVRISCGFLFSCSGYYRYDQGFSPEFPGAERFAGKIVHPQHWPEDLDYSGKRVVVIGSGATAVTLVPAMAPDAASVTMLQRSPTYITALPSEDPIAAALRKRLPVRMVYPIVRWKNVALQSLSYQFARRRPEKMKAFLRSGIEKQLPAGYDIDTHFAPRYNPWDQRLCLVPDGDLFTEISRGRAEIVTDTIETFIETGIRLTSGRELPADVIVTATGLNLQLFAGMSVIVDGEKVALPSTMAYKGMMLSGLPNFAFAMGYTNASWTLKVDLTYEFTWRLMRYMDEHGYTSCVPEKKDSSLAEQPFLDFAAGYVLRSVADLPKQGPSAPWRLRMNYLLDLLTLRFGRVDDGVMSFRRSVPRPADRLAA